MANCTKCGSVLPPAALSCPVCKTQRLPTSGQNPIVPAVATPVGSPAGATGVALFTNSGTQHSVVPKMVIGRDVGCHLQLADQEVSRRHAMLEPQGSSWSVTDLGSSNGTFVNDQQVFSQCPLRHGDRLRLGTVWECVFVELTLLQQGLPMPMQRPRQPAAMATQRALQPRANQTNLPAAPALNNWGKNAPSVEGHVISVMGPQPTDRDNKMGKAFLAVLLGLLISPVLAFLPFAAGKNQILSTVIRVEQMSDKSVHDIVLLSDYPVQIEGGDLVAVWAKYDNGWLHGINLYSYRTGASLRFKK